jgi:Cu2+-exporting ATPase
MKSVIGAGVALEKLAALMPDTGHLLNKDGSTLEVAVNTLKGGEHLLVKPGEKIPPTPSSSKVRPQPMNRC